MTYNRKIKIQVATISTDDVGMQTSTWNDFREVWVNVNGLYGADYWSAAQNQQENTLIFTMRWFKALDFMDTVQYRVIFDGDIYDIKDIDNVLYKNQTVKIKAVAHI